MLGGGNRDWAATYQATPRLIDERLAALGGQRIRERGEADAREDQDSQFRTWFDGLWPDVGRALELDVDFTTPLHSEPLFEVPRVERVAVHPVATHTGAEPMTATVNRELQQIAASGRSTRHVELALPQGVTYQPGDHLCVVPRNHEQTVRRAMQHFGFDDADHIRITVGVVAGPARSGLGEYHGVCSSYLAGVQPGDEVHAVVRENRIGFKLPDQPTTPMIMIGPGTGLAPFRGFLQQRAALRDQGETLGPALLLFGCRHPEQDYLYREELEAAAAEGVTDLLTAFSRADDQRVYVQDLLRRERDRVWSLLEAGAVVYVCGDGSHMEPDVKRSLATL